ACEKGRRWSTALILLDQMHGRTAPDDVSYAAVLTALSQSFGSWRLVLHLLHRMTQASIRCSVPVRIAAISAVAKSTHWQRLALPEGAAKGAAAAQLLPEAQRQRLSLPATALLEDLNMDMAASLSRHFRT
ncbi:unnamed protein product, partial [Effrenium voratum]